MNRLLIDSIFDNFGNINDYQRFSNLFCGNRWKKALKITGPNGGKFFDVNGQIIFFEKDKIFQYASRNKRRVLQFESGKISMEGTTKLVDGKWLIDGHIVFYNPNGELELRVIPFFKLPASLKI